MEKDVIVCDEWCSQSLARTSIDNSTMKLQTRWDNIISTRLVRSWTAVSLTWEKQKGFLSSPVHSFPDLEQPVEEKQNPVRQSSSYHYTSKWNVALFSFSVVSRASSYLLLLPSHVRSWRSSGPLCVYVEVISRGRRQNGSVNQDVAHVNPACVIQA